MTKRLSWISQNLTTTLLVLTLCGACKTPQNTPTEKASDATSTPSDSGSWHNEYIEDNCSRCPECCVNVPEDTQEPVKDAGPDIVGC